LRGLRVFPAPSDSSASSESLHIEVESKYRVVCSVNTLLEKLFELGAVFEGDVRVEDHYFAHPCRDFRETDEALRLRIERGSGSAKCTLSYKGPRENLDGAVKKRVEIEVEVGDPEALKIVLSRLGFSTIAVVYKKRSLYRVGNCVVSVDFLPGIGYFVEVEGSEEAVLNLSSKLSECLTPEYKTYLEICLETRRCLREYG